MTRIDDGHKALQSLARTYGQLELSSANEAETRFHVIDEVLRGVLGWQRDDITVEERIGAIDGFRYADYIVRTAVSNFVVEAKKAGETFQLPTKKKSLKLGGVLSQGNVGDAISQVREYCQDASIPFAVVTNGSSWIVFDRGSGGLGLVLVPWSSSRGCADGRCSV